MFSFPSLLCALLMANQCPSPPNPRSLVRSPPRTNSHNQCGLRLFTRVDTAYHVRLVRRTHTPFWLFLPLAGAVYQRVGGHQDRKVRFFTSNGSSLRSPRTRLMEHFDSLAGSIAYKHMLGPSVQTLGRIQERGFYIVTASVDRCVAHFRI